MNTALDSAAAQAIESSARRMVDLLGSPACLLNSSSELIHGNCHWQDRGLDALSGYVSTVMHGLLQCPDSTGAPVSMECSFPDHNGRSAWYMLQFHPLSEAGQPARMWICITVDIQAMKDREGELRERDAIRSEMLNVSVDCIKLIDLDGRIVHLNSAGCLALGLSEEHAQGTPWLPLLPEDVREGGRAALAKAYAGNPARFPGRSQLPGQPEQHWDNMLTPVLDAQGKATSVLCVSREVTAEHKALQQLTESQERLAIAARVGGLGIWDYDIVNDRLHCDESWYRIVGRDSQTQAVNSVVEFRPLIHPEDAERATEISRTAAELIAQERDYSIAFRIIRPNGDVRWVRSLAYLQHQNGVPIRAIGFVADITDAWRGELALRDANRALEEEKTSLARQILEDPLTGIANRRHLDSELARMCLRARELGQPICVGMIDVDHFKLFNDRYGHLEGDMALRRIASALQEEARQSDFVARYGGEEFAFVLTGTDAPAPAVERFLEKVSGLAIAHDASPNGRLTISCGAIVCTRNQLTPRQLIKASDDALYAAKVAGRNRFVIRRDSEPLILRYALREA